MRSTICNLACTVMVGALAGPVTTCAGAELPKTANAQVTTESGAKGLKVVLDGLKGGGQPVWVGYSEPVLDRFSDRWTSEHVTYLEGDRREAGEDRGRGTGERREFDHANVLLRVAGGAVEKVRLEAPDRALDAGGMPLVWLNAVSAEDSVRAMAEMVKGAEARGVREGALLALAVNASPAATAALVEMTGTGHEEWIREKAAFWLASQRGHEGFVALQRLAHADADERFREKLTFDMTVTKDSAAVRELVRMAHEDASPRVRRQAQFWMATKGGKKVAADLHGAAENDADAGVRNAAVFAISRLPKDEAATQLIALADTSKDPAVRRQAVFWLGQSNDPRALEYLTRLLNR